MVGLGEAGYGSVGAALIASHFPARMRGALLAGFFASASVGSVLGVMLGGVIASRWGWQAAFGVVGIPGSGAGAALPEGARLPHRRARARRCRPSASRSARPSVHIVKVLARSRTMLWVCIGGSAQLIVVSAMWSWLPSFLNRVHGIEPGQAALKAALVVLAGAAGAVVWGAVVDRAGARQPRRKLMMLALLCLVSMAVLMTAFGAPLQAGMQFPLILLGGFLMTCSVGPVSAIVIDVIHPGVRATGSSVLALFQNLFGLAAGPFIAGVLSDVLGLTTALTVMPAFAVLAAAAFLLAARSYEADKASRRRGCVGAGRGCAPRWPETLNRLPRKPHERNDDAATAADLVAADPRRAPPRRSGDRLAARRRRPAPLHLPRPGRARAPHGERAGDDAGGAGWRAGGHAGLERLPPHGAVLRGERLGLGAAHAEPAPAPRPGGLDRRPRRGPGAVLRPELPAADRGHRRPRQDHQDLRRADRSRAHAGVVPAAEPAVLRGTDRRGERRLRLAGVRREHGEFAVLHLGHDRQPEGRAVQPPLDDAAHLCRRAAGRTELLGARRDPAGGADVPRQRLGPALCGLHGRRQARLPGPVPRRQEPARPVRSGRRHGFGRRADRLAGAADARRGEQPELQHDAPHHHRRLGLPAGDDARLPGDATTCRCCTPGA